MSEYDQPAADHTASDLLPVRLRRFIPVLAVIAISVAVVGLISGFRDLPNPQRTIPTVPPSSPGPVPSAVNYTELPTSHLQPNSTWEQRLEQLRYERPGIFEPVVRTEPMKLAALADRAWNRAFDGAPPTISHTIESRSTASCLACHGEGLKVGEQLATKMSHATLSNCTQCHVEQVPGGGLFLAEEVKNSFVGIFRSGPGERASPGAPPTIPHHTWMRETCTSCHGTLTRPGTRTTHPWLTNCTQCHVPSAALDQVSFRGANP